MKRTLALAAVAALAATSTSSALAAPKPQTSTLWFHGTSQVGQQDTEGGAPLTMDKSKPTGSSDRYYPFAGAVATPNTACAASPFFPNWIGSVSGEVTGKAVARIYLGGSPGSTVRVQLFDNGSASACNSATTGAMDYPEVLGEVSVAVPAGPPSLVTVTIPIKGRKKVHGALDLQVMVADLAGRAAPQLGAVAYDSTASPSSLTFTCLPKPGRKSCLA